MRCFCWVAGGTVLTLLLSGCTALRYQDRAAALIDPSSAEPQAGQKEQPQHSAGLQEHRVANPPAKTIRFEGRETVLGVGETTQIATEPFCHELASLLTRERYFTATNLVARNSDAAEQVLWDRCADAARDPMIPFIAHVLSQDVDPAIAWEGLLVRLQTDPSPASQRSPARLYQASRTNFANQLKSEHPTDQETENLRLAAQRVDHPLVMVDALRLIALRELAAERFGWAESLFMQAAEIAQNHNDMTRAAECWLMVATTTNRSARPQEAQQAWLKSVQNQLANHRASPRPLNASYWVRVDEQRPEGTAWPASTATSLAAFCMPLGFEHVEQFSAEQVLYSSIGVTLFHNSQPELGLVYFKKAEGVASGEDVMWLRIAQSECLAALGQCEAAAALLSGPASSKNPAIASAATATLGIAKLKAGAYEQGASMLHKALHETGSAKWPTRDEAQADFALTQLIIGDTDQGLEALHAAQEKFHLRNDRASLLQSLENERKILIHEGRTDESTAIERRIREIERV